MKYCNQCGARLDLKIPPADNRLRFVCISCETVHYQNPKIVAGCIPEWNEQILLCKRGIEPRYGYWTLPAGFMEIGESSVESALRETAEEANARVEAIELYAVFNIIHVNQVYMMFRSHLLDLEFSPGDESLEVKLFKENQIPWDELAFTAIRQTLKFYYQDRKTGQFRLHTGDIIQRNGSYDFKSGPAEIDCV